MDHKIKYEKDELRGRFTRFMEVVVRNARNNYLKKLSRQLPIIPLKMFLKKSMPGKICR